MHGAKWLQLCLILCNPVDCRPPGSSVHEILECVAISFRVSSRFRNWTPFSYVSCICHVGSLPLVPPGKWGCVSTYTFVANAASWNTHPLITNQLKLSNVNYSAFPGGSAVKNLPEMEETQAIRARSLGCEDPLKEGMTTHSSNLAWKIPWTKEPGGLQSLGCKELDMTEVADNNVNYSILPGR